jgi:hypothetical protein
MPWRFSNYNNLRIWVAHTAPMGKKSLFSGICSPFALINPELGFQSRNPA